MTTTNLTAEDVVWKRGGHLPELDGVRGFAILIVSIYRFGKEIPVDGITGELARSFIGIGERGVDLFFLLSGFLITGILLDAKESQNGLSKFFARRALRIFPLYFSSLILFLFVIPNVWPTHPFASAVKEQIYLWTHLANIRMSYLNVWCFGPLNHFWSLAVEEHFYLFWPIIVFALSPKALFRTAIGLAVFGTLSRIVYALIFPDSIAPHIFTLFRFDALCIGSALVISLRQGWTMPHHHRWAKWAMILGIVSGLIPLIANRRILTLADIAWTITWAAALFVLCQLSSSHRFAKLMRANWLRQLGKYSYAMYIFQSPLIPIVAGVVSFPILVEMTGQPWIAGPLYVASMLFLTFAAATLSWHLLEKHFLKLKPRYPTPGNSSS